MRLWEKAKNLGITGKLRLFKNSTVDVQNADGTVTSVTPAEVAALSGLAAELALLDGVTATADEINQAADVSAMFETVTATKSVDADENGKTFFLDAAAGFVTTLPEPALGLRFKFIVATAPTSNGYHIVTTDGDDIMKGVTQEAETDTGDDGPTDQNADDISFTENIAVAGDWLEFVSDGTSWFFTGQAAADGSIVTATT